MTALNPVFTIGSQIAETLLVHGRATRRRAPRAIELLDAVRVPEPAPRVTTIRTSSRAACGSALIAMALACEPALVIADEPTTALDVTIQAQILDLLREHEASWGWRCCSSPTTSASSPRWPIRVAVMYAGRIVEEGAGRALFADPKHPYTRGLLASMPGGAPGERLKAIQGTVPPLGALPPGCSFAPRCPIASSRARLRTPVDVDPAGASARCYTVKSATVAPSRLTSTRSRDRTPTSMPLLEVRNLVKEFSRKRGLFARKAPSSAPSTTSASRSTRARRSGSSASRAAARRRPGAASCG